MKFFLLFLFPTGSHGCIVTFQPLNNRRGALFQHAHTSGRFWSLSHVIFSSFFIFSVVSKTLFSFSGGEPMPSHTHTHEKVCVVVSPRVSHFFVPGHVVIWFCHHVRIRLRKNEKPKKKDVGQRFPMRMKQKDFFQLTVEWCRHLHLFSRIWSIGRHWGILYRYTLNSLIKTRPFCVCVCARPFFLFPHIPLRKWRPIRARAVR